MSMMYSGGKTCPVCEKTLDLTQTVKLIEVPGEYENDDAYLVPIHPACASGFTERLLERVFVYMHSWGEEDQLCTQDRAAMHSLFDKWLHTMSEPGSSTYFSAHGIWRPMAVVLSDQGATP